MTQKTALILAAVLTAFVLVVGVGLIARMSQPQAAGAATIAAPISVAPAAPAADVAAQMQELLQQREAQYRQLIDQANQRLAALNEQVASASAARQTSAAAASAPARPAAPAPAAPQFSLSADAARNIAVQAANFATMIRAPELVRFEGKVAYEVGFTRGVVYIDANTGDVLFNGTQGSGGGQIAAQQPAGSNGGPGHDGEHETEHGDD